MLHACCGPCLLEPFDALAAKHDVIVCYANPNIAPPEEYERRRDTLVDYAASTDIEVIELPYEPFLWRQAVAGWGDDRAARCRACYRLRVSLTAHEAARVGCEAVATTLSVSPYQDIAALHEEGERACAEAGVAYLRTDFRDRYREATNRSRALGMYRQNYCGCLPSRDEAEAERAVRRATRERERPVR